MTEQERNAKKEEFIHTMRGIKQLNDCRYCSACRYCTEHNTAWETHKAKMFFTEKLNCYIENAYYFIFLHEQATKKNGTWEGEDTLRMCAWNFLPHMAQLYETAKEKDAPFEKPELFAHTKERLTKFLDTFQLRASFTCVYAIPL